MAHRARHLRDSATHTFLMAHGQKMSPRGRRQSNSPGTKASQRTVGQHSATIRQQFDDLSNRILDVNPAASRRVPSRGAE
jgi:hypothetical protein